MSINNRPEAYCTFPEGFLWGVATAAAQIEGAAAEDGRSPSVWDVFSRRPGATAQGATPEVACDHYHRYREDVALMKDLGVQAYRFSVSWSRVLPDGTGQPNEKGLDFYERLVDKLLAAGIEPWMTLFHWDLPQVLEDRFRGWESRECSIAFADYAHLMAARVGDRVAGIFTFNEFLCFLDKGYGFDPELFAPGKKTDRATLNRARHHALLAHGLAVQAMRAASPKPLQIGLAENVTPCVPVAEQEPHIAAARDAFRQLNGTYLVPIMEGAYHPAYLQTEGADAPVFTDEEMRTIAEPIDFLGLNLYNGRYIKQDAASPTGWSEIPCSEPFPHMPIYWLSLAPQVLHWVPRFATELWQTANIYITENGCPYPDHPDAAGEVWDTARVMFLQQYLIHLHRAVAEGYPVRGYFLWSLMDNFEWAFGYTQRFGLCHTDFTTQKRTPKLSAKFYRDVIARNAIG